MISDPLKKILYVVFAFAAIISFVWKPLEIVSQTNNPDQNPLHIRKVFKESRIGQTASVPWGHISEIELKINKKKLPDETPIQLSIKKTKGDENNLRQINTTLGNVINDDRLVFNFKPIARDKIYFELAASTLNEKDCIALRYQIDSEKYPNNQTYINDNPVYGDLAFSVHSSPPVVLLLINFLFKHPTIALAIILFCAAIFMSHIKQTDKKSPTTPSINLHNEWSRIIFIFVFTFLSFAPLLNMYFRQDDFVILDRARTLLTENPIMLLTNRGFVEASRSDLPVHIAFYRPISNSVIPALLYKLFGLNAFFHYLFNFLIHAASAVGVYLIFRHFLNKNISFLAALIWATHSAVFITVSWLSSIQEILSAFFFIYSLLAFSAFWKSRKKIYRIFSVTLFLLAILSKENSFLFLAIAPLFILASKKDLLPFKEKIRELSSIFSPYLICSALILSIRDWMLREPGLHQAFVDHSYKISLNPLVTLGNISASLSWSIQSWVLGFISENDRIENYLAKIEETTGWTHIPPLPILLILFTLVLFVVTSIAIHKKRKDWWFPLVFYLISSLPFLMLLNERQVRWQYLPIIGLILVVGISIQNFQLLRDVLQRKSTLIALIIIILFGSQWSLAYYPGLLEAKKQSAFTKQVTTYIQNHYPAIKESARIVLRNVPPDREQNLGYAAFPLLYSNSAITTVYERENGMKQSGDIYLDYISGKNTVQEDTNSNTE